MDRNVLVPVMALSILNGIFSPFMLIVYLANWFWYPGTFLPASSEIIAMLSSIIFATLTLMVSGVPAAVYERTKGQAGGRAAGIVWLVAAAFLTLPAIPNALRALGL
jgi:hypothetical protein